MPLLPRLILVCAVAVIAILPAGSWTTGRRTVNLTEIVLLALAFVWALVLVPGWVRAFMYRGGRRTPMMAWQRQLNTLSHSSPASGVPAPFGARVATVDRRGIYRRPRSSIPNNSREAAVRRRDVLRLLALGSGITLFGWVAGGLAIVGLTHMFFDLALVTYLVLLNQRRKKEIERLAQIHYLKPQIAIAGELADDGTGRSATK
ncbi:MAG TPA: hypothetical protein DCX77_07905 [Acidimicrobiaceae bacterium]|nr:hypothetical protein [Acidimicrobiaceae bacterium]HAX05585.1 hypothetical protein [Acidimicrobiaceae bacterium]